MTCNLEEYMRYTIVVLVLLLLSACNNSKSGINDRLLKVDLDEQNVSVNDLFERIEVVPLETTDSCLIIMPQKVNVADDKFYVFDEKAPAVYVFDEKGAFLSKVGKKGQGPGEYREIYDVIVNSEKGTINMLSPFGSVYVYNLKGDFIEEVYLPDKSNYQVMEDLNDDYLLTWTIPSFSDEAGISIISKDSMKVVKEYWRDKRLLNFQNPRVFHKFDGEVYFSTPFRNEVYAVSMDTLRVAYQWEFGDQNIEIDKYKFTYESDNAREEYALIVRYLRDSTIPYIMSRQYQNNDYYYAKLTFGFRTWKNLFYRKSDGKSLFFERTSEGIKVEPLLFTNEYIVCVLPYEEYSSYQSVLNADEYKKLSSRTEDDNLCLVKFYFK